MASRRIRFSFVWGLVRQIEGALCKPELNVITSKFGVYLFRDMENFKCLPFACAVCVNSNNDLKKNDTGNLSFQSSQNMKHNGKKNAILMELAPVCVYPFQIYHWYAYEGTLCLPLIFAFCSPINFEMRSAFNTFGSWQYQCNAIKCYLEYFHIFCVVSIEFV